MSACQYLNSLQYTQYDFVHCLSFVDVEILVLDVSPRCGLYIIFFTNQGNQFDFIPVYQCLVWLLVLHDMFTRKEFIAILIFVNNLITFILNVLVSAKDRSVLRVIFQRNLSCEFRFIPLRIHDVSCMDMMNQNRIYTCENK